MQKKIIVLHLDDDPLELRSLKRRLEDNKEVAFTVLSALDVQTFTQYLSQIESLDFAILDIHLANDPFLSGLKAIELVKKNYPRTTIIMNSNLDDSSTVLKSLRFGADEFLSKKHLSEGIAQRLLKLQEKAWIKKGILQKSFAKNPHVYGDMMQKIALRIPGIIQSSIRFVYVEGESGTGKEVVADLFARELGKKPFVKLNCAAIPKDLLESELFGHKRGAFTGAQFDKKGVIEAANGGWLFLDEVSSLTSSAQAALLRALENQEVTPIGETKARKIDVRFISASNISLSKMVDDGNFRNDLWQRLREAEIKLLPLYERKEEIPRLILSFCENMEGGPFKIEKTALNILSKLSWREGNVRELRNCLRAMTEHHYEKLLSPMAIPERILTSYIDREKLNESSSIQDTDLKITIPIKNTKGEFFTLEQMVSEILRCICQQKKQQEGKVNISKLCQELGISRSSLQAKIKLYNLI